jgi:hypothetical protein
MKGKFSLCFTNYNAKKKYWKNGCIIPRILNLGGEWSASRLGRFKPRENSPVPIGDEAGWTPRHFYFLIFVIRILHIAIALYRHYTNFQVWTECVLDI